MNHIHRRRFFRSTAGTLSTLALYQLLTSERRAACQAAKETRANPPGIEGFPQYTPKAKRVLFLFQAGGPSQIDLLDYKPGLRKWHAKELPKSVMGNAKFTGMVNGQSSFPVVASPWKFERCGGSGAWISEMFPHFRSIVDDVCIINSMTTPQVDHDAALTFIQTGHQLAGRPCFGAWAAYGLGSECDDLPAFVVLRAKNGNSFLSERHWGAGFLPSKYQGIRFGGTGTELVRYLNDPQEFSPRMRRRTIADVNALNALHYSQTNDPEIETRIAQYEMAARMQTSVPQLADFRDETEETLKLYGDDVKQVGSYANNALLARRLLERGVRFVQVFQGGWDHHDNLPKKNNEVCRATDQANAALIKDLKRRGLLEDTLVIWGGEFGRTVFCQGKLEKDNFGREHHGMCFTMWAAGGGIKPGIVYGKTDDFSFRVTEDALSIHDFYATVLHLLGIEHTKLTYRFQGRDFRLTDLAGQIIPGLIA